MSYTPCRYAQRWPDLWERLPDDRARRGLSSTLANGRLEGMEPGRELVEDLVARARGEMSADEFRVKVLTRARSRAQVRAGNVERAVAG